MGHVYHSELLVYQRLTPWNHLFMGWSDPQKISGYGYYIPILR